MGVGVVMCANIALPVVDLAHSFIHSSLLLHLICCLAVSNDVGTSVCGSDAPFFANLSARSLPGMFACPGIHWRVSSTSWSVMKVSILLVRFFMLVLSSFPLSNACRTDFASENMTMLFPGFVFCLKFLDMWKHF